MAFSVRDVMVMASIYRPDVNVSGRIEMLIQEVVKKVCLRTYLAIEKQTVAELAANTHFSTMSSTLGNVLRANRIRIASQLPSDTTNPSTHMGTFNASTGAVTPVNGAYIIEDDSAPQFQTNGFYICSVAGSISPDSITLPWVVGDLIYSNGTDWVQVRLDEFTDVIIEPESNQLEFSGDDQSGRDTPSRCSQRQGVIKWISPPTHDTAIEIELSYCPSGDITSISLPPEAEDVIKSGVLEMVMKLPGDMKDLKSSMLYRKEFNSGLANLRARAYLGEDLSSFQFMPMDVTGGSTWLL